jgi:transketolase
MRNAFASTLTKIAQTDQRIVLLSGDIGNKLFDSFKEQCPGRFFNCGVAEANMTSMAAGMALCGLRPVTYTIASFVTVRCLEQIRIDVCYHNLPVIIVGVGAGLSYAELGATHHSCEDIAMMRVLPNMTVICPADSFEVRAALRAALKHNGPVYIRLGKKGEPIVHGGIPEFVIGKGIIVRDGKDVCLLSTGNILSTVMEAAEMLQERDISARVVSFHTVKPLDAELLSQVFAQFRMVVSIEEHSILGGFGSSIAEWLVGKGKTVGELICMGAADTFFCEAGKQKDARRYFSLTPETIAKNTMEAFFKKS